MSHASDRVPLPKVSGLIAPGQPLPFRVLDAEGRLLLAQGQVIASARQLEALLERGACVEYADAEAVRRQRAGAAPAPAPARQQTLFDHWEHAMWALDGLVRRLGHDGVHRDALEAQAREHVALVDREPDAALFLCVRQPESRHALYALTHGMHAATAALLAARLLDWPAARLHSLVCAALTMNASIVELQARMAEQSDPPTKKQIDEIRAHPHRSAELLRHAGVDDAEWLGAVEDHHERIDGSGYPRGEKAVGEMARLLRAADIFTAKVSPRALRPPVTPQLAARQLFVEEAGGPIAAALIKTTGLYPPGDFVRLHNGDAAIVVHRAGAGHATQVVGLQDARGRALSGAPKRDTGMAEFAITGAITDHRGLPRVLPEQVYGLIEPP